MLKRYWPLLLCTDLLLLYPPWKVRQQDFCEAVSDFLATLHMDQRASDFQWPQRLFGLCAGALLVSPLRAGAAVFVEQLLRHQVEGDRADWCE